MKLLKYLQPIIVSEGEIIYWKRMKYDLPTKTWDFSQEKKIRRENFANGFNGLIWIARTKMISLGYEIYISTNQTPLKTIEGFTRSVILTGFKDVGPNDDKTPYIPKSLDSCYHLNWNEVGGYCNTCGKSIQAIEGQPFVCQPSPLPENKGKGPRKYI